MRLFQIAFLSVVMAFPCAGQDHNRVYQAVVAGMNCKQSTSTPDQMECEYRVGKDLHFVIAAVGEPSATFTIFEADWNGDYYVSYASLHGCVVVNKGFGKRNSDEPMLPEFTFVSLQTGKVYDTWPACANASGRK
jgi:hypothetical protein